jgi:hypothetical protein
LLPVAFALGLLPSAEQTGECRAVRFGLALKLPELDALPGQSAVFGLELRQVLPQRVFAGGGATDIGGQRLDPGIDLPLDCTGDVMALRLESDKLRMGWSEATGELGIPLQQDRFLLAKVLEQRRRYCAPGRVRRPCRFDYSLQFGCLLRPLAGRDDDL